MYAALKKLRGDSPPEKTLLVHSRFRGYERNGERDKAGNVIRMGLNDQVQVGGEAAADRIIVATQVVEAGVDISARTLVTELAPWASIVQRIGRCNRTGHDGPGRVFWIDLDEKLSLPYDADDLEFARTQLGKLDGKSVSPKALDDFKRAEGITLPFAHKHVVRRRDVLDLFDTAPDLSGNDIDVSRFVRSDDPDTDVQVFWRAIGDGSPDEDEPQPVRRELCSVPVGQAREFLKVLAEKKRGPGFVWDHLDDQWVKLDPNRVRPGLQVLLPVDAGGYSELGWDPTATASVDPVPLEPAERQRGEAAGSDPNSAIRSQLTIAEHTRNVCQELSRENPNDPPGILDEMPAIAAEWGDDLRRAARWHDVGKALPVCQKAMHASETPDPGRLLAKSGRTGKLDFGRYGGKHFRHELGSALAVSQLFPAWRFLVPYLVAAHHGRVRLGIRALPGEEPPDPNTAFALGVRDGDVVPPVDLGGDVTCPETRLSLAPMRLGGPGSWTGQSLKLLGELGPFALAYLEAIVRAADVRASQKEAGRG